MEECRIVIFGTGKYYQKYKKRFLECNVVALVDNDVEKYNTIVDGIKIISVTDLSQYVYDFIVILVFNYMPVVSQLQCVGVDKKKIVTIEPEGRFSQYRRVESLFECNNESKKMEVLLLSHEMNMRGAPLMLYELGRILKGNGVNVEVATTQEGDLVQYFCYEQINVLTFDDFIFSKKEIITYFEKYRVIIVNTLVFSELVNKIISVLPETQVIWWLHEEWSAYRILKPSRDYDWKKDNLHIYGVGKRAIQAFYDFYGYEKKVENLQWGIKEEYSGIRTVKLVKKVVFAVVGEVNYIKGQDLLNGVTDALDVETLEKIEIWVIGRGDLEESKKLGKLPSVKVFGEMDHRALMDLYSEIDVVMSLSRNDTMPVVLVEGMMNKKIIMTSTGTGIADYIDNHNNGIVYESENISAICKEIRWIIDNNKVWKELRCNAYRLYQDNFSVEKFEKDIMSKIKELMV